MYYYTLEYYKTLGKQLINLKLDKCPPYWNSTVTRDEHKCINKHVDDNHKYQLGNFSEGIDLKQLNENQLLGSIACALGTNVTNVPWPELVNKCTRASNASRTFETVIRGVAFDLGLTGKIPPTPWAS